MSSTGHCSRCGTELHAAADEAAYCVSCLAKLGSEDAMQDGTTQTYEPTPTEPGTIGPYRILERIGEGGMGVVYLAEQTSPVRQRVAVKILKAGLDTRQVLARFEAERQALALMEHSTIAKVLGAGATEQGRPYFAMEYVPGHPITEYCDRHRLSTRERLELFMRVCEGIQHAHQKAILHRDIKPSNVLVTEESGRPVPKIIDFGIAKATAKPLTERTLFTDQRAVIGTPEYMSPEQADPGVRDIDTRTDVYSLGVLLYEVLIGALPFDPRALRSAAYDEMLRRIREEEPSKPSTRFATLDEATSGASAVRRSTTPAALRRELTGDLDWIVMRSMEKERSRRYDSPSELAADIARHLRYEPVVAGPPSTAYRLRKFARRHRLALTAVGVVFTGVLIASIALVVALYESNRQRTIAEQARDEAETVTSFLQDTLTQVDPKKSGRSVTVREVMDRARETIDHDFGTLPLVRARLLATIASVYGALGEYEQAEPLQLRAHDLYVRIFGSESIEAAAAMNNLAEIYTHQAHYDEAERLFNEAIRIESERLGEDHLETLKTKNNLGVLYSMKGDLVNAEQILAHVYEQRLEILGPEHLESLDALDDLATLNMRLGRFAIAEEQLGRNLANRRSALGNEHPETISALSNLASAYMGQRQNADAVALLEEALSLSSKVQGPAHPETLIVKSNLASCYSRLGKLDQAEALQRETLEVRKDTLGSQHPDTLMSMYNLAVVYQRQGRWDLALPLMLETAAARTALLGPSNPLTLQVRKAVALTYQNLTRYKDAVREYEALLVDCRQALGGSNRLTQFVLRGLASSHWTGGNAPKALALVEDARDEEGMEAADRVRLLSLYGAILTKMERFQAAEDALLDAHREALALHGEEHALTRRVTERLSSLYADWGKPEAAQPGARVSVDE